MPPKPAKGADKGPSKKTEQKKKEKVVEDKTFGLKNKKGTKQQKFIQHVQKQTFQGNVKTSKLTEMEKKKADATKKKEELNALFKPVEQKIGKGVDPKSVLCAFFKQGNCGKGAKCKFSHDLNIARKGEKRNIYDEKEKKDTMEDWDEATLEDVVNQKHGEKNKALPTTSIICKFFLDAVEANKYGWFWECQNGTKCHYRHALPPGFVLKRDQKKEDKAEQITIEELIERERAALNSQNLTKVTLESFLKWKQKKRSEKIQKMEDLKKQKKADYKQGKMLGVSGRELFEFNPDLIVGDEGEDGEDALLEYRRNGQNSDDESEGPVREINLDAAEFQAKEVDASCTQRVVKEQETGKLDEAAALPDGAVGGESVNGDMAIDTPIDENLFDGDDIDLIDDELDELILDD